MEKETISSLERELKDKANEIVEQIANDQNILTFRGTGSLSKLLLNFFLLKFLTFRNWSR
jgi:hypothetical protein